MSKIKNIIIFILGNSFLSGLNICLFLILYATSFESQFSDSLPILFSSCSIPILNMFSIQKKYFCHKLYLSCYFLFNIFLFFYLVRCISYYFTESFIFYHNFIWKYMIYIFLLYILFFVVGIFVKKIEIRGKKHDTFFLICLLLLNLFMLLFSVLTLWQSIVKGFTLFVIFLLLVSDDYRTSSKSFKYQLLFLCSFLSFNFLGIVISVCNLKK